MFMRYFFCKDTILVKFLGLDNLGLININVESVFINN